MKNLILFILSIGILLLGSCIKEIQLDTSEHVSRLAVMADIHPEGVRAYVTYSVAAGNNQPGFLPGVHLEIWERDRMIKTLEPDASSIFYIGDGFQPSSGKVYILKATHPDFDPILAQDVFPPSVHLSKIDYQLVTRENDSSLPLIRNTYEVALEVDPLDPNIRYLEIIPSFFYKNQAQLILPISGSSSATDDSPLDWNFFKNSFFVSGETIREKQVEKLTFQSLFLLEDGVSLEKIQVEIRSVSESYFKFFQSAEALSNFEPDIFILDPIYLFSNIENGYGYLGSYQRDTLSVQIQ